jgi:hypothetical protein
MDTINSVKQWSLAEIEDYYASLGLPILLEQYTGPDAVPISDADLRRCGGCHARANAARIFGILDMLQPNTLATYKTCWKHFQEAVQTLNHERAPSEQYDLVAHPIDKVTDAAQVVLEKLPGNNPKATLDVFRSAMGCLRHLQGGIPNPDELCNDVWMQHVLYQAGQKTASKRHAPEYNSLLNSKKTTCLDRTEFEALIDAGMTGSKGSNGRLPYLVNAFATCGAFSLSRCSDLCTMKYKAIFTKEHPTKPVPCTLLTVKKDGIGKTNNSGEWRSGAVARHKDAHQDAQGWLADLFFYDILVEGVDLVDMALNDQASWQELHLFNPESPRHKPGAGGSWAFETQIVGMLSNQLAVAGLRHLKNRTGHLLRNSGALWASEIVDKEEVALMGEWKQGQGVLLNSYCAKSQSSALRGHLAVAGFSGRESHFLGRSTVEVPPAWLDAVAPGARRALEAFEDAHVGESCKDVHHGVRWSLKSLLYLATVWWQNLPVKYERYRGNYTLANVHVIKKIMHSDEYRNFAIKILQLEDKSQRLVRGPDVFSEAESPSQAPAALAPPHVAVPGVKEKVKIQLSISFGSCRACVDLWTLWEEEKLKLESLSKRNDVIIGPVMQKRRLEAVACAILRLGEERGGVADGIDALQSIWEELDALERSLGGKALSLALFVDGLENIINCTKPETLMSNLKGQGRTKVTKQDLKTILDRHWQLTSAWPSVSYADDSEDLHVSKRFKT